MSLTDRTGMMFLHSAWVLFPHGGVKHKSTRTHHTPTHTRANTNQEEETEGQGSEIAELIKLPLKKPMSGHVKSVLFLRLSQRAIEGHHS